MGTDILIALRAVGRVLHSEDRWQGRLSIDLAAYNPVRRGPGIDGNLVERLMAGTEPVPAWVVAALPRVLGAHRLRVVADIDALARELGFPLFSEVALSTIIGDDASNDAQ